MWLLLLVNSMDDAVKFKVLIDDFTFKELTDLLYQDQDQDDPGDNPATFHLIYIRYFVLKQS